MMIGTSTAVPRACTMRPVSSSSKPGAAAAMAVPRLNSPTLVMKIVRSWNRCMM